MGRSGYIPSLDGLRAVSIALVVLGHAGAPVPTAFGVTVFFFISGYLITLLFTREYDAAGGIDFKAFYIRRILRLTPPIVVVLAVAVAMQQLGWLGGEAHPVTLLSQLLSFYNYILIYTDLPEIQGSGLFWSLAVEEHFYMLFPLFFLAFARGRVGFGVLTALLAGFLVWRLVKFTLLGVTDQHIYLASDSRMDSILWGAALALAQWRGLLDRAPQGWGAWALPILAVLLLLAEFAVLRDETYRATARYTTQGILLAPITYYAVTRPDILMFRPLNWGWVRWIGVWSYVIYLIHAYIQEAMKNIGLHVDHPAVFFIGSIALSIAFAAAVYRWVEGPFRRMRRKMHAG